MVRSGDVLEARARLPGEIGARPAIWTWRDGDQESDVFEYHPDLLEFSNHVRGAGHGFRDDAVRPGSWVDLRTEFGARSVVWSVNGVQVFADRRGVGHRWHAFPIVNLSVCAGRYHPAPAAQTTEMSFEVSSLVVRRPAPHGHPPGGAASAPRRDSRVPRARTTSGAFECPVHDQPAGRARHALCPRGETRRAPSLPSRGDLCGRRRDRHGLSVFAAPVAHAEDPAPDLVVSGTSGATATGGCAGTGGSLAATGSDAMPMPATGAVAATGRRWWPYAAGPPGSEPGSRSRPVRYDG
ncbi:hypothetical protein [Streptomyces sp. NPDC052107]|uniref:hypothetical protein n=1 Tax=Streptomyces sp. NPDC052107 TaxID=3155632 RepID=UPI00342D0CB4